MTPHELLYPQSRFEVLRTLHLSASAVSLREISYRSGVVLHNVQRAIKFLLQKKIISKKIVDQRAYYQISDPKVKEFIASFLGVLEPYEIKARAESLKVRSAGLLDKLEERSSIIRHAKGQMKR